MPFGDKLVGYETEFQNTTIKQVYEKLQQLPFLVQTNPQLAKMLFYTNSDRYSSINIVAFIRNLK